MNLRFLYFSNMLQLFFFLQDFLIEYFNIFKMLLLHYLTLFLLLFEFLNSCFLHSGPEVNDFDLMVRMQRVNLLLQILLVAL